ncbi:MAG: hypothetical protein E6J36_08395 [Chloroflexi bacterium]|nr:MAG: hypothetical protein E6J36_08395 [Chloroflexota bacterium]
MQIRPYGDTANDGVVQLSFTLPLPLNARAKEAARRYAMLMGINNPLVAHAETINKGFSFFVINSVQTSLQRWYLRHARMIAIKLALHLCSFR